MQKDKEVIQAALYCLAQRLEHDARIRARVYGKDPTPRWHKRVARVKAAQENWGKMTDFQYTRW